MKPIKRKKLKSLCKYFLFQKYVWLERIGNCDFERILQNSKFYKTTRNKQDIQKDVEGVIELSAFKNIDFKYTKIFVRMSVFEKYIT